VTQGIPVCRRARCSAEVPVAVAPSSPQTPGIATTDQLCQHVPVPEASICAAVRRRSLLQVLLRFRRGAWLRVNSYILPQALPNKDGPCRSKYMVAPTARYPGR